MFRRRPPENAVSALSAADELSKARGADAICRKAVELARDRLGLERVALFLIRDDGQFHGTFGTGHAGQTTDERDIVFAPGDSHREAFSRSIAGVGSWLVLEDVPLLAQIDRKTVILGYGWNVLTPARSPAAVRGLFVNDAALTGAPLDEDRQLQLAIFAAITARMLDSARDPASALPWGPAPRAGGGPSPHDPPRLSPAVAAAMSRLNAEPTLETAALARKVHLPARALAKQFREQVGMTLVDYRNRVRLERFFEFVRPSEGNLLEAALDAGFGSYAQFHRVFRRVLGVTPHEYVSGRRAS
jgi:AraC-like DNA-binding protein